MIQAAEDISLEFKDNTAMELDEVADNPIDQNRDDNGHRTARERRPQPPLNPNNRPEQDASQPSPPKRHGYAAVEIHKGAARVIRWEREDPRETSPEQVKDQRRLFRLGEWLSKQPISDQARAEYFDIERVSCLEN